MHTMIIWGAGRLGVCALHYFRDYYDIDCFVDSDSTKWGKHIDEVIVQSPEIIKENNNSIVVVANRNNSEEIVEQLKTQFGIKEIYLFNATCKQICKEYTDGICVEDSISLRFTGGLGNQMFQYALLCLLREKGKRVYVRNMNYGKLLDIERVFPKVLVEEITSEDESTIIPLNIDKDEPNKMVSFYKENLTYGIEKKADLILLRIDSGIIQGVFQTSVFPEMVKTKLLQEFVFAHTDSDYIHEVLKEICSCNSVSVHVRRGDYLSRTNEHIYGNICTVEYYKKAMNYIMANVDNPIFYVFSNSVEEAQNIVMGDRVKYIDLKSFDGYEDWFDMYLMSQCKNNIIANSTFSWWGAWLNQNDKKIVIAPSKWVNTFDYKDIYPSDWIVIS